MTPVTTEEIESARQHGLMEGRIRAIEKRLEVVEVKQEQIDKRISIQDKITWSILGAIALIQSSEVLRGYFSNV